MKLGLLICLVSISLLSCNQEKDLSIKPIVDEYYQTYSEREDFEKFLAFYDSSMVLKDMINGNKIKGTKNLRPFFDWTNPNFELQDSVALIITDQILSKYEVVTSGYFTPFTWHTRYVEAMQFTTILRFNTEGKIVQQVDWINYPSYLVNYETRKNSNIWINKSE